MPTDCSRILLKYFIDNILYSPASNRFFYFNDYCFEIDFINNKLIRYPTDETFIIKQIVKKLTIAQKAKLLLLSNNKPFNVTLLR